MPMRVNTMTTTLMLFPEELALIFESIPAPLGLGEKVARNA